MPWGLQTYIVPMEHAPPEDQPWLMSTVSQLEADKQRADKAKVDARKSFPGSDSDWQAKRKWEYDVADSALFDDYSGDDVCSAVYYERAPQQLLLEVFIRKCSLEQVLSSSPKLTMKELSKLPLAFFANNATRQKSWLKTRPSGSAAAGTDSQVFVFSVPVNKTDTLKSVKDQLEAHFKASDLGITIFGTPRGYDPELRVGDLLHYPSPAIKSTKKPKSTTPRYAVGLIIMERAGNDLSPQVAALQRKKEACNNQAMFLRLADPSKMKEANDEEEEEEEEVKEEDVLVTWIPSAYSDHFVRIANHVRLGEGEATPIKHRLMKGNTDTGNIRFELFSLHFDHIKRRGKSWSDKFAGCLALATVMAEDCYWMQDNECYDEVAKLVADLGKYMRTTLFMARDDATLGIGHPHDSAEERAQARQVLMVYLEMLNKDFLEASKCVGVKYKFPFKPGKPRGKRKKKGQPATPLSSSSSSSSCTPTNKRPKVSAIDMETITPEKLAPAQST